MADDYAASTTTSGTLQPGGQASGILETASDIDWFRIAVVADRFYTFNVAGLSFGLANQRLGFYDSQGNQITDASIGYDINTGRYSIQAPYTGELFVGIGGRNFGSVFTPVAYTVTAGPGIVDDIVGTVDARVLLTGRTTTATFDGYHDIDYFRINLVAGFTYALTPNWNPDGGESGSGLLLLVHGSGGTVEKFDSAYASTFTPTRSGTYFIAATALSGVITDYQLTVSYFLDDHGATAASAGTLGVGTTLATSGRIDVTGDRDWYGVALAGNTSYSFKATGKGSLMKLLDEHGNVLANSTLVAGDAASSQLALQYTPTAAGTYYLEVSDNQFATGAYTVRAELGSADDHGDSIALASTVVTGRRIAGTLGTAKDQDVFKLAVTAGQSYLIELNGEVADGAALALSASTVSQPGFLVKHVKEGVGDYRVLTATTTGDYYFTLSNSKGAGTASYALQVAGAPADDYATGQGSAGVLAVGEQARGRLDYWGDVDTFKVTLQEGARYTFQLRADGADALNISNAVRLQLSASGSSAIINPASTWDGIYTYTATAGGDYFLSVIPNNLISNVPGITGGYSLQANAVDGDITAPSLVSYTPVRDAGPFDRITLQFSEAVMRVTGSSRTVITLDDSNGNVLESFSIFDGRTAIDGNTLTIAPRMHLDPGSAYRINVPAGTLSDLAGNKFAGASLPIDTVAMAASGGNGNDYLAGTGTGSTLYGGSGVDTAVYAAARSGYAIERTAAGTTVIVHGGTAGDTLHGVERLLFKDAGVALDIDGEAGQAYRLYRAAFDRAPDKAGIGYWIAQLDKGAALLDMARSFLASDEFTALYGNASSNTAFVNGLYGNVLARAGDAAGVAYWVDVLSKGAERAFVLKEFSESAENQAAVVQVIGNGFEYTPWGSS